MGLPSHKIDRPGIRDDRVVDAGGRTVMELLDFEGKLVDLFVG